MAEHTDRTPARDPDHERRRRQAWALLREWIQRFGERALQRQVLLPAHEQARRLVDDRGEAWDVTLEAFEALLDSLAHDVAPLLAGGEGDERRRDLAALVAAAEVDGRPLLLVFLRQRLLRDLQRTVWRRALPGPRRQRGLPVARRWSMASLGPSQLWADVDPVEEAERHEEVAAVQEALNAMTAKLREAQELAMQGLSQRQIAHRLQLSRGAVRWRLEQAQLVLHERLSESFGRG